MARSDIWVVPHGAGWGLKLELGDAPFVERSTQAEAIASGRALAKRSKVTLVILDEEGRLQEREAYRGVPRPPADFLRHRDRDASGDAAHATPAGASSGHGTDDAPGE